MAKSENRVVIVSAKRTLIGNFGGYYKNIPAVLLSATALDMAFRGINISPENIDEIIMGCVLSAGLGQAPARQSALIAKLPVNIPCTTVNKMCGSSMKTVAMAFDLIKANQAETILAGGMENMSQAPYLLPDARFGYRMGAKITQDHMMHDGLIDAYPPHLSMGAIAEQSAQQFKITREAQDQFALTSLERAKKAAELNYFKDEIATLTLEQNEQKIMITKDEGLLSAKPEKISTLKPVFDKNGTITAANSSRISDGAAALCIMSELKAKKLKLAPLATIVDYVLVAQQPNLFPTAPVLAIETLLKKLSWKIPDVDLFEINEAFAVVVLIAMQKLAISRDKMNVNGGACVLGHPIGASGARILVTLVHALKRLNKKRGIATLCIAGGEAMAVAIEI